MVRRRRFSISIVLGVHPSVSSEHAQSGCGEGRTRRAVEAISVPRNISVSDVPRGVLLERRRGLHRLNSLISEASTSAPPILLHLFLGSSFHQVAVISGRPPTLPDRPPRTRFQTRKPTCRHLSRYFHTYSDEPNADAGALPVWFLSKLTRRHATVALSREGALTNSFGGIQPTRPIPEPNHPPAALRRLPARCSALSAIRLPPFLDEKISFEYKLPRSLPGSSVTGGPGSCLLERHFHRGRKAGSPARACFLLCSRRSSKRRSRRATRLPHTAGSIKLTIFPYPDISTKVDRMSMAHSIEVLAATRFLITESSKFPAPSLRPNPKIDGFLQKVVLKSSDGREETAAL